MLNAGAHVDAGSGPFGVPITQASVVGSTQKERSEGIYVPDTQEEEMGVLSGGVLC